jgi:hypothetical protein
MKRYQLSILAGALFALGEAVVTLVNWQVPTLALEAPAFLLSMSGLLAGSRPLRSRFQQMKGGKIEALSQPAYMRERIELQYWAALAVASLTVIAAIRWGFSPVIAVPVFAVLTLSIPVINRATGWHRA